MEWVVGIGTYFCLSSCHFVVVSDGGVLGSLCVEFHTSEEVLF